MLTLHELEAVTQAEERPGDPTIAVTDASATTTHLPDAGNALLGDHQLVRCVWLDRGLEDAQPDPGHSPVPRAPGPAPGLVATVRAKHAVRVLAVLVILLAR